MARMVNPKAILGVCAWPDVATRRWPPARTVTFLALRDLCRNYPAHYTAVDVAVLSGLSEATAATHLRAINTEIALNVRIVGNRATGYRLDTAFL
jgi:hypothetical protein